jgi:DNA-binding transcriptional LysR family regulator
VDLRHLRAFVAVAEESSFTKAARRLHLSQPPLSRQIRQLEGELGVTLFVRHRDRIELTSEGRVLLEKARTASLAVSDFREAARSLRQSGTRTLRLGIGWGLWSAVDRVRAHHARRFPDQRISVHDLCADAVQERNLDVTVVRPPVDDGRWRSRLLFEEHFIAILSEAHPLAERKAIRLLDLASVPLLMYERGIGPGVYDKALALYRAADVRPPMVEAQPPPYSQAAMMLVASGQGFYIGIASPFTQTHRASGVAVVPLDEPDARLDVRIAWRRDDSSAEVQAFLRSAREVFASRPVAARTGAA